MRSQDVRPDKLGRAVSILTKFPRLVGRLINHRDFSIVPVSKLTKKQIQIMFVLFEQYYQDVTIELFEKDLSEKNVVLLLKKRGKIIGFSTQLEKLLPEFPDIFFLFSGDTVLHKDHWGSKRLQKAFFWYTVSILTHYPGRKLYWMLMSKGHKTYLLMTRNFKFSYPRQGIVMPENVMQPYLKFYKLKFGEAFYPESQLIQFNDSHGAVKSELAQPGPEDQKWPEVKYFLQKNPGYIRGDELACIAHIRFVDLFSSMLKYLKPKAKK